MLRWGYSHVWIIGDERAEWIKLDRECGIDPLLVLVKPQLVKQN